MTHRRSTCFSSAPMQCLLAATYRASATCSPTPLNMRHSNHRCVAAYTARHNGLPTHLRLYRAALRLLGALAALDTLHMARFAAAASPAYLLQRGGGWRRTVHPQQILLLGVAVFCRPTNTG